MSLLFDCLLRAFVEWSSPESSAPLPAAPGRTHAPSAFKATPKNLLSTAACYSEPDAPPAAALALVLN